jgi:hypothetical protein
MNANYTMGRPATTGLEDRAAQLAQSVYGVALQYGVRESWIQLEVEIWRALVQALEKPE